MSDEHTITATFDCEGNVESWTVHCPYDPADETRPCWALDVEADPPVQLPAPQGCNYAEWVENIGGECIDGKGVTVTFGVEADWSNGDYPVFVLVAR